MKFEVFSISFRRICVYIVGNSFNMKNALFVITLLFFVSNCQSSRDKCYEFNTDDDWGDSCKILILSYEPNANVEKNQKHLDLSMILLLPISSALLAMAMIVAMAEEPTNLLRTALRR